MELSTPKTEGKLHHARAWCISFPSVFGVDTSISPKNITTIPYHFISTLLNANFDVDVSVANDVAKCALPGKVMQWSPCPEVRTLTNENGRYIMKLNDKTMHPIEFKAKFIYNWKYRNNIINTAFWSTQQTICQWHCMMRGWALYFPLCFCQSRGSLKLIRLSVSLSQKL